VQRVDIYRSFVVIKCMKSSEIINTRENDSSSGGEEILRL
jgi:hypothetical protein